MALDSAAIATGIAALTITDPATSKAITIMDVTEIPTQVNGSRDCPVLFPDPADWIGGSNGEPSDGPATFGPASTRYWMFDRRFRYVFLQKPVGAERSPKKIIPELARCIDAIQTGLTTLDLTGVDVKTVAATPGGIMTEPSGGKFYGCFIDITLRERLNP